MNRSVPGPCCSMPRRATPGRGIVLPPALSKRLPCPPARAWHHDGIPKAPRTRCAATGRLLEGSNEKGAPCRALFCFAEAGFRSGKRPRSSASGTGSEWPDRPRRTNRTPRADQAPDRPGHGSAISVEAPPLSSGAPHSSSAAPNGMSWICLRPSLISNSSPGCRPSWAV